MKKIEEIKGMLGLEKSIEIIEIKEEGNKIMITIKSKKKKYRCPSCDKYTASVHDKLKPIKIKYLSVAEKESEIKVIKRRFICHKCKKKFTEELNLNGRKRSISNTDMEPDEGFIESGSLNQMLLISQIDELITDVIYYIIDNQKS